MMPLDPPAAEPGPLPTELCAFRDDPDVAKLLRMERVGSCRIGRLLGEGGMGMVFLAEQEEPIRRTVALKILRLGLDTRQALARFQLERQALARIDHPAIAKVHEAGATEDGRPYFVMEYVPGESITAFCDGRRLPLAARLELFREVCRGVQHAHQKGILHRDLKPSNILVAEVDGVPRPKIIDFGVAKSLEPEEGATLLTHRGEFLGTPEYASPEQAAGLDLDTRADIYALGVLLHELLLGVVPLARSGESLETFLGRVRTEEPLRPSRRARRLHASMGLIPPVSARRLRGDLDWIVLKALEKDRARRYSTAAELEADIGRHLRSEPVLAQAPSAAYFFWKALRRHRGKVIAAAAVLLVLLAGLVASTLLYLQASSRYQEVLRLSDRALLAELHREAEFDLWPFYTWDRIDHRLNRTIPPGIRIFFIRAWIGEAKRLLDRLPKHRRILASMRAEALELPLQRIDHPEIQFLEEHRLRLETLLAVRTSASDVPAGLEAMIDATRAAIERLDAKIQTETASGRTWRHPDPAEDWRLQEETRLVAALELLGSDDPDRSALTDLRERLIEAERLRTLTCTSSQAQADWTEATAAIAADPRYDGLILAPQLGLLPLGEDPLSGLHEFWHVLSGERPEPADSGPGRWRVKAETGMVLVLLPGGAFRMGAQKPPSGGGINQDLDARPDESPVHEITLDPFFLSKYEVTQGQWARWCRRWFSSERLQWNRSFFTRTTKVPGNWNWPIHPAEQILPSDAELVFFRMGLTLPTEAQWEYACRAGTSAPLCLAAGAVENLADRSYSAHFGEQARVDWDDGFPFTAPVGSFAPNPFGLHDLLGNVSEAILDLYNLYVEPPEPGTGRRPNIRASSHQVRGGNFRSGLDLARSSARNPQAVHGAHIGARAARAVQGLGR